MGALTDLCSLVRRKCPGIMDIMMLDALADSYREFCTESEYLAKTQVEKNVDTVALVPAPDHTVLKVESVTNNQSNGKVSQLYLNDDYTRPNSLTLIFNTTHQELKVTFISVPKAIADPMTMQVEDDLIERYGAVIAVGAAMKLRLQPAQPWTEPGLAEIYSREFVEGCRKAYRDRRDGFNTFHNKTRKRDFF